MHVAWLLLCSRFKDVALNSHGNKIPSTAYRIPDMRMHCKQLIFIKTLILCVGKYFAVEFLLLNRHKNIFDWISNLKFGCEQMWPILILFLRWVCMQMATFCLSNTNLIYSTAVTILLICSIPFLGYYINFNDSFFFSFFSFCATRNQIHLYSRAAEREFIQILNVCYELRLNLNFLSTFFSFCLFEKLPCLLSNYGINPMEIPTQVKDDKLQRFVLCMLLLFSYSWIHIGNKKW